MSYSIYLNNIKPETMTDTVQKITPCLWVEKNAKAVADYYLSIFKDGKLKDFRKFDNDESGNDAGLETAVIEIAGIEFSILAAGPLFKFNEAISLMVSCADQAEIDYFWEKLSAVPDSEQCGWLKDKFGLAWQIVPDVLLEWIRDDDPQRKDRVMTAMMKMKKLDIKELEKAAAAH